MGFRGYVRDNGKVGTRNHVVVMSSVSCVNGVVNEIARAVPEVKAITHTEGCGRGLADVAMTTRTLAGLGKNPNVFGILVIGLGCEFIKAPGLADQIRAGGGNARHLVVQEAGGSRKAAAAGIEIVREMLEQSMHMERTEAGWEGLTVGLECGGSDALSGITANPLVGAVSDWLIARGATVILSETTEMIGTEKVLARRACDPELATKLTGLIAKQKKLTEDLLGPFASMVISPGNIEGGLSNITEKSLGCIIKGGDAPVQEVLEYGATPTRRGLVIMDTPGSDIFSLTGMAAGGAALMLFTTGRGTPAGFPIVPVIKVASNTEMYRMMEDDMDINAGLLLEGMSMSDLAGEVSSLLTRVAEGEQTKAEQNRQDCFAIHTVGSAF